MQTACETAKNDSRIPGLRAVSQALARYGWQGLASRVVRALVSGGPALLLHKIRVQRSFARNVVQREETMLHLERSSRAPAHSSQARAPCPGDATYVLDVDHSLPLALFDHFMNRWDKHAAIRELLTVGCATQQLEYTVVVTPHSESGLANLTDTLALARNLARRANIAVRVVVYDPEADAAPFPPGIGENDPLVDISLACSIADIRRLLEAGGSWHLVQFLVCGDQICPVFAEILARSTIADFDLILTDMYFLDPEQNAHLILLPGVNPIHALNVDYFLSRSIMKARLAVEELANLSSLDIYELTTAVLGRCIGPGALFKAHHIAFPMLLIAETRAAILQRRAGSLARTAPLRLAFGCSAAPSRPPRPAQPRVSVVICTRDNGFLIEQLVEGLWSRNAHDLADIVVVANRTTNPYAIQVHKKLAASGRAKLIKYDQAFNFSAQSNLGAAAAGGDLLLFLNDDIVPVNSDWLDELISPLEQPEIGVVGPLLLYPDQTVQHAGMFLGFNNIAGHTLRGAQLPQGDYCFMASAPRQVMAVTGAALGMRRSDFEALNGFDQNLFALHIQDVDLCLRAHFSGLAVIYNPRSVLLHMESVSVKPSLADPRIAERRGREHAAFLKRWGDVLASDEFHNPNFARAAEDLRRLISPAG